jgi:hypothetical protein
MRQAKLTCPLWPCLRWCVKVGGCLVRCALPAVVLIKMMEHGGVVRPLPEGKKAVFGQGVLGWHVVAPNKRLQADRLRRAPRGGLA